MIGSSKKNRENYLRKCFGTQEKETRVNFNRTLSANRPSNLGLGIFLRDMAKNILHYTTHYSGTDLG